MELKSRLLDLKIKKTENTEDYEYQQTIIKVLQDSNRTKDLSMFSAELDSGRYKYHELEGIA